MAKWTFIEIYLSFTTGRGVFRGLNRGVAEIFPEARTIFYNNIFILNTSSLPLTTRFLPPFGPFL